MLPFALPLIGYIANLVSPNAPCKDLGGNVFGTKVVTLYSDSINGKWSKDTPAQHGEESRGEAQGTLEADSPERGRSRSPVRIQAPSHRNWPYQGPHFNYYLETTLPGKAESPVVSETFTVLDAEAYFSEESNNFYLRKKLSLIHI